MAWRPGGYSYILTCGAITSPTTAPTRRGLKLMSQLLREGTTPVENTTMNFIQLHSLSPLESIKALKHPFEVNITTLGGVEDFYVPKSVPLASKP